MWAKCICHFIFVHMWLNSGGGNLESVDFCSIIDHLRKIRESSMKTAKHNRTLRTLNIIRMSVEAGYFYVI